MEPSSAHPTFSIVIETENLSVGDLEDLTRCLESIKSQDLSPENANEVLLVESGDVPSEMVESLQRTYPWISRLRVPPDTGYYEAKRIGAGRVTGQIVVFCDSDCQYEASWLRSILSTFGKNEDIQIVAGETSLDVTGPLTLALMLTWSFPAFSGRKEPYKTSNYLANNVSFRREFLMRFPIPEKLPVYRGNCAIHANELRRRGYTIWKQPRARAIHPAPFNGLSTFLWRWLMHAQAQLMWHRLSRGPGDQKKRTELLPGDVIALIWISVGMLSRPFRKLPAALRQHPAALIYLPFAVPVVFASSMIFLVGLIITFFSPNFLLKKGTQKLGDGAANAASGADKGVTRKSNGSI